MTDIKPTYSTNYVRRAIGMVVFLGPVALAIASYIYGKDRMEAGPKTWAVATMGLSIGVLNAYLSWVHPLIQKHDRFVSGIPGVGTLCTVIALIIGFRVRSMAIVAVISMLLDTAGLPWFLFATWKDRSLWDDETPNTRPADEAN